MQPAKKADNKNLYRFIVLFIAGLFAGILITYFIKADKNNSGSADAGFSKIKNESDSLKTEFSSLQSLNSDYSSLLEKVNFDTTQLYRLDSLNVLITRKELGFLEHLDNIDISNNNSQSNSTDLLKSIVAGYRSAAQQSTALNNIRNAFNIGNTSYSFDQNMLNAMQKELRSKETEIASLQKSGTNNNATNNSSAITNAHDSLMSSMLVNYKKRNQLLVTANSNLQRDIKRIQTQSPSTSTAAAAPEKATLAPVSSEYTNEQVSLAQVDCYLSRSDANQIISNARQRKDLLQNALGILNSLSKSGNSTTRQQAELKLSELKRIAANNHD